MRFKRWPRQPFNDTNRKRSHVLRKYADEQAACPLFADQIAELQPSVDDVMAARRSRWDAQGERERAVRAAKWRDGRMKMRALPAEDQAKLMDYWNSHRWLPGDPSYFLDMIHMWQNDQLNLDAPNLRRAA